MPPNGVLKKPSQKRTMAKSLRNIETDATHHLVGSFRPQTPLDAQMPETPLHLRNRPPSPFSARWSHKSDGLWNDLKTLRWVVVPSSSIKMILLPILLWSNWELLAPFIAKGILNPFAPILFISHRVPSSTPDDPRYQKGYLDLIFILYWIVVWSFVRQVITIHVCHPVAKWFGIKKISKLDRFGEQGYAMIYFAFFATWGMRIMSQQRTWWYRTEYFWIDYPHWDMKPELKAYYLIQAAYWCQQLMVLILNLEKPRKDYHELVAHHFVTLWLVGWSYLVNLTLIGNAVYLSMDLPDSLLAFSKLLNYLQFENAKIFSFGIFMVAWSYFRHFLNIVILYSVWTEFDLIPESSKRWSPEDGIWLVWWLKYQIFVPILLLQFLNIFWYFLILRVAKRAITQFEADDDRSDDEGEDDEDSKKKN